jgi:PIN domain nuclease of toxin-antitoxin system
VRLLLDTHVFLWYVGADSRLSETARNAVQNADFVYLSVASVWEATIKYQLGKLNLPEAPLPWLRGQRERHGIDSLSITESALAHLVELEPHHRDPFDRILICQAIEEDLQIVTVDPEIALYPVRVLPAR